MYSAPKLWKKLETICQIYVYLIQLISVITLIGNLLDLGQHEEWVILVAWSEFS